MELVELRCKSCGAMLREQDIEPRLAMARCSHCDAVFGIKGLERPVHVATSVAPVAAADRTPIPMPRGIEVVDLGTELQIKRRWFHPVFLFLAVFCVFWNGFMLIWHAAALAGGAWFMSVFGLLHTAVGVGLAYFTLAGFLNTTTIRVARGMLRVVHQPLPWFGSVAMPAGDVKQLYCREKVSHGKNGTRVTYQLHAVTRGHRRQKLLSGLNDAEQALFVEQELERHLKIEDRPVRGELAR